MGLLPAGREEGRGGCADDDWLGVQRVPQWKLGGGRAFSEGQRWNHVGKVLDHMLTLRIFSEFFFPAEIFQVLFLSCLLVKLQLVTH